MEGRERSLLLPLLRGSGEKVTGQGPAAEEEVECGKCPCWKRGAGEEETPDPGLLQTGRVQAVCEMQHSRGADFRALSFPL